MVGSILTATTQDTGPERVYDPLLNRYSYFVAFAALLVLAAGAAVASLARPIAPAAGAVVPPAAVTFEAWHQWGAVVVALLILGQAVWATKLGISAREAAHYSWMALGAFLVEALLGLSASIRSLSPLTDILHALLGAIAFALIYAVAVVTSRRWQEGPSFIEDTWRPSLRTLAMVLPAVVLLQITLGAAFRYRAASVLWHILNAMVVLLLVLIVCIFLIRQFPAHPSLRPVSIALAGITSVQVFLGFATFLMLLLFPESSLQVIIFSVLHVANGALTLSATASLSLEIRRNAIDAVTYRSLTAR